MELECVDICLHYLEEEVYTTTVKAEQCGVSPAQVIRAWILVSNLP